jgi:hypothetical protein
MIYKLFLEEGKYRDITTHEDRNMMEVEIAYTPDGINVGWDEYNSIEEAMTAYNIEIKPEPIIEIEEE